MTRRHFLGALASTGALSLAGCMKPHLSSKRCPGPLTEFEEVPGLSLACRRIGPPNGPGVVLLHELPGMTPDDLALARCISRRGFNVHVPLLFGEVGQDKFLAGLDQACRAKGHQFECTKLSTRSPILDRLDGVCRQVATRTNGPIAVIGMCLTGIFPLALLGSHVQAAVLCQPTVPFTISLLHGEPTGDQKTDLGLGEADLANARKSTVPFLAMHYTRDSRCPVERIRALCEVFGERAAVIAIDAPKGHSTLAGDLHPGAFEDAMNYLEVRLRKAAGPKAMTLALLGTRKCEITAEGSWRAL
jgi:dienelactone hydrolase